MHKKAILAGLTLGALLVAGCGGSSGNSASGGKERHYAIVTHGAAADPFWQAILNGGQAAAKAFGGEVTMSGNQSPVEQSTLIDNAVARKVDGIITTMANPQGLKGAIERAIQAGIPVYGINAGMSGYRAMGLMGFVGSDELLAGQEAGKRLKALGGKRAVCVIGAQGQLSLETRCDGFSQTFGGHSEKLYVDKNNVADVQNQIQAKLKADPSIDTIITTSALGVGAANSAIEANRFPVRLATFDVNAGAVKLVEEGKVVFAVDQQPYLQGYLPVEFLDLYYENGNSVGGGQPILTGPNFITKENAAEVAKYAGRGTR